MKSQEVELAQILHHFFASAENKFLILANKISQMDQTTGFR